MSDSSEILAKISNIRLSEISSNECTFEIFRLGTQLALVTCDDNIDNRFPETIVSNLNASSTSYILIKDGKYLDDLTLKCIFKGLKLNSIKPSDFRARITYRNNIAKTSIKVNGANVVQTIKADNTVPGYSYVHSFEIDSLSDFNLMNSDGEVAFILNLKGVEIQSFSSGFLIEFFNKVNSEKILPYSYTEFYTLNKAESVNLALISNDGNLADETNNFYILNPTFSVTSSYDFGDIDKEKIAKAISVSNVDSEKISKVWNDKTLTLSFNENLETETLYTISIADVNDIEGLSISTFEDFTFTTRPENKIEIYNIEYDYNGGNVETQNPTTYYLGSSTFTLNNPTKEGYDFIGWSGTDLSGNNNLVVSIEQGSTGNRTYTANYKPTVYNINYELNEGQILANNPVSYDITSPTITLNNPVKDGYRFIGWTGSNGDEPQISVTIDTGSTGDKSFTANYLALDYLIICNLDGGVLETPNPSGYNKASDSITLNNPTKYGYEFIGWTNEEIFIPQMIVTIEKGSTGDKTYTANYTAINYPIVYILDGGNFETTNPESYDICSETIILNNPIKEGFTFVGWTSEDITTPQKTVIIEKGSTGSKTFTANWSLFSYKVTLNKGKGIAEVSGDGVYGYGSQVIASCTMLEGYEFDFWTGNNTEPNFTMPNNDVVMQANAKPINYSIECDLKEGNLTTDNINSYNIDSDNITLINPTRLGYTFTGWTGTDLDSASMTLSIPQGSIGNRAYTANWVLATYTITYNVGDGNVESPNFTTYYITSENIILNNPVSTRDYYLFKGWSGTELEGNENLVVTIPQGSVGDREYTANYAPESFQINYEYDGVMSENPESYDITTLSFLLNNPTKEGYDFLGWEGTDIPIGTASKTVIIYKGSVGQRNYVASYTKRYSIDYELDGGNVLVSNP
ncbi:MAG: InlB B-repeat-containing protein, partial [Candidatus Riflebacteria bacterium]|nr:InlB B-repeat-containing protein [Candidatus Riflebacteria bacterium]